MKSFKRFIEEELGGAAAANSASAGQIAGIGVGPQGEPGGTKSLLKKKPYRRSGPTLEQVESNKE